jgi:rod shape-determining protein MreD
MSWPVVLVFGYLLLGIELVIPGVLRLGPSTVAPSFVLPFVVFIAMFAPASRAYWTAIVLGLSLDLLTPWGGNLIIPGPRALGFVAAVYLVLTVRTIINRNTLALIVFSVLGGMLSQIVIVALLTFRSMYSGPTPFLPREELVQRIMASLYTGGSAALLSLLLFSVIGLFRFQDPYTRGRSRMTGGMAARF